MKKIDRKKSSVKELQAECKKRKIGFMTSWTKIALTRRLEDEDIRDKEIEKLKEDMEKREAEFERQNYESSQSVMLAREEAKKPLVEARRKLKEDKKVLEGYEKRIKELMDEKFGLMQKSKAVRQEVEQLQVLIKSLI